MTPRADELIRRLIDGTLGGEGAESLRAAMRESAEVRELYVSCLRLHGFLSWDHADTAGAPRPIPLPKPDLSEAKVRGTRISDFRFSISDWKKPTLIAAALLLVACGFAIYLLAFGSGPETRNSKPDSPIASVIESTGTLVAGDRIVAAGEEIAAGDLSLDAGSADFRLHNGVLVRLIGSAALSVRGPMHATLMHGFASFDCPHGVKGFTVDMPDRTRIVDLGTRFTLNRLDSGRTDVDVLEGRVRIDRDGEPEAHVDAPRFGYLMDRRWHELTERPVAVDNHDFELPSLADWSFAGGIPGWTADRSKDVGVFRANERHYRRAILDARNAVDGVGPQALFLIADRPSAHQTTAATIVPGRRYTLTVAVGSRLAGAYPFAGCRVELLAGDDVLASTGHAEFPGERGTFVDVTAVYDAPPGDPHADEPVTIRLAVLSDRPEVATDFDNVRLTESIAPDPRPIP